eukprot:5566025-Amphidinium_carterae.1
MVHRALQEAGLVMGESTVINVGTSKLATETIDATQKARFTHQDPLDRGVECKTTTGVKGCQSISHAKLVTCGARESIVL